MTAHDPKDVLPLSAELVDRWTETWEFADLSEPMLALAVRFWAVLRDERDELPIVWHHLLMTVGNFKRQAPIRQVPLRLPPISVRPEGRFPVPGHAFYLLDDDPQSWATFERALPGFGVATTTTLLSALWPGSHCVIDRLAFSAAVGLRALAGHASRGGELRPDDTRPMGDVTWHDYEDYRRWVFGAAQEIARPAAEGERTLFLIRLPEDATRTWRRYGEEFLSRAGGLRLSAVSGGGSANRGSGCVSRSPIRLRDSCDQGGRCIGHPPATFRHPVEPV